MVIFILAAIFKNTKYASIALKFNIQYIFNNNDIDIKLYQKAIIKLNKRFFNLIVIVNNYIMIFNFRKIIF